MSSDSSVRAKLQSLVALATEILADMDAPKFDVRFGPSKHFLGIEFMKVGEGYRYVDARSNRPLANDSEIEDGVVVGTSRNTGLVMDFEIKTSALSSGITKWEYKVAEDELHIYLMDECVEDVSQRTNRWGNVSVMRKMPGNKVVRLVLHKAKETVYH